MRKFKDETEKIYTENELRKEFEDLKRNGETDAENFGQYLNNCLGKNGSLEEIAPDYEIENKRKWTAVKIAAQSDIEYEKILEILRKWNVHGTQTMYEIYNRPVDIDELQECIEQELGWR